MSMYQEYLYATASGQTGGRRRGGKSVRAGIPRRAPSVGEAPANAGAPFRVPRPYTAANTGEMAPSHSTDAAGASATPTTSAGAGTAKSEAQDDDIQEDDATLIREGFDKANWNSYNNFIFYEICLEEMRTGNSNKGCMTNRGYKNIQEKFFLSTKKKHSIKQLRNRWTQLKGLYQFWLWINKQTTFGRANGTVVAMDSFWKEYTKGKSEWKKLRKGPPEHLGHLEEMFEHVAIDGSSSCIPGEHINSAGDDGEGDDVDEANEFDVSSMSSTSRKRASSTSTSATSPEKKTKSPMVKIMKGMLENLKADSAATQKVLQDFATQKVRQGELMAESMKKAQRLVECGAAEDSVKYFMAGQLFLKAENR